MYLDDALFSKVILTDDLVQERRNPIANALELRLFCTNPSIATLCSQTINT